MNAQSHVISLDEYRTRRSAKQAPAVPQMPVVFCWAPVWFFVPTPVGLMTPSW